MPEPSSILEAFLVHVDAAPNDDFIFGPGYVRSRKDVAENASSLRHFFAAQGIGIGSVVGLANTDQVLTFESVLALWSLGAMPVVLDFRVSSADLDHITDQTKMTHIFSDFKPFRKREGVVAMDNVYATKGTVDALRSKLGSELLADVLTSSGTTGPPKINTIKVGDLFEQTAKMVASQERGPWGNIVSCLNLAFSGTRLLWYRNAISGKKIVSIPLFFKPSELDEALRHPVAQESTLPPIIISALTDYVRKSTPSAVPRYPNLLKLQSIGGPLVGDALLAAKSTLSDKLYITYSTTQTGVLTRLYGKDIEARPHSVGKPRKGITIEINEIPNAKLTDSRSGAITARGRVSSVVTGDLGYLDDDGYLYITGRSEGLICRNGVSFPAEHVENQINAISGVTDSCVVPGASEHEGEDVVLVGIEINPSGSEQEIVTEMKRQLSSLQRPSHVFFSGALPRTSGLKISRAGLLRHFESHPNAFKRLN